MLVVWGEKGEEGGAGVDLVALTAGEEVLVGFGGGVGGRGGGGGGFLGRGIGGVWGVRVILDWCDVIIV